MKFELLHKYISGYASEAEKELVTKWIMERAENMHEYRTQRKLYEISLWRAEHVISEKKQEKKRFSIRTVWIEAAKIAAVVALVLFSTQYWFAKPQTEEKSSYQSIHVPAGQRAEIILADGTKVWLNSRSTLSFPGNFTGDTRHVKLDGEGYFAVTENVEQPFIVETNKYNVKVLGTEFNVIAYETDNIWETSLLEGSVEILTPGINSGALRLEANTRISLRNDKLVKGYIQEMDYFRWREGLICFTNVSLSDMIDKLILYYGVDIVVNNKKILNNRYTGKFRSKDGIEHVLKVLRLNINFTYTKDDERNIITID